MPKKVWEAGKWTIYCSECEEHPAMEDSSMCEECYQKLLEEGPSLVVSKKVEFAMEFYYCNLCGKETKFHVKLPSKLLVSGGERKCVNCGATEKDLTFNKVYTADEYGRVTE